MRDANELQNMEGVKYIATVPKGETIKQLIIKDGVLFIATETSLYKLIADVRLDQVQVELSNPTPEAS